MINQGIPSSIAMVDMMGDKLKGEALDLHQGSAFLKRIKIEYSTEYDVTEGSHLVIITAGVARKPGDTRLQLVEKNIRIMSTIIPQVLEYSPDATICIVANPVDIMTGVAAKLAGPSVPAGRIFGSGTCLDSSRLRSLIAKTFDIDAQSVHGYIIGEHGASAVPVWSSVRIGGVPLLAPGEEPGELHEEILKEVVDTAGEVIKLKGYTNWAIGLTVASIAGCVLGDHRRVMPVTTCVRGLYGIEEDVFLSTPCVVGSLGVTRCFDVPLTPSEEAGFKESARQVWEVQQGVWDQIK
jgi:L-lactate dehydrogenase